MTDRAAGRLTGKVVVVTGAGRGQGEREARLFAAEGARVVLTDLRGDDVRAVAADIGPAAAGLRHDVSAEEEWAGVVSTALDRFGRLDGLVNNAAIHHLRPIGQETADGFRRVLDVNLLGPFLGVRAVTEAMRAGGGGSIVNISSTGGLQGYPAQSAYCASKWGLRGFTKVAALELGPLGIRVNSVHPGMIDTAMLPGGPLPERARQVPIGRIGNVDDVAQLVLFLVSDESSYLTGAELTVDGGLTAGRFIPPPEPAGTDPAAAPSAGANPTGAGPARGQSAGAAWTNADSAGTEPASAEAVGAGPATKGQ